MLFLLFHKLCTVQLALIIYWIGLIDCQWIFYVFWIIYHTNHRIFTNKININNESINCAPISQSSSSNNNKIEWWRDRRCRRHFLFVIFNNLIILQYNTFVWLVFSIEMPVWCINAERYMVELTSNGNQFSEMNQVFLYVLIDGKLPLFTIQSLFTNICMHVRCLCTYPFWYLYVFKWSIRMYIVWACRSHKYVCCI